MSASGKARVTSPAPQRRLRSSERHRRGETDRVDCVRIVHWTRNALAYVPRAQQTMVAAGLRQAFQQPDQESARTSLRYVAEQLRERWPKLTAFIAESAEDVLAYLSFPAQHRTKLHSTNPLERLNKEVKRRADVVGIFPNTE